MITVSNKIDTKKLNDMAKIMSKEDAKLDMKSEMVNANITKDVRYPRWCRRING